MRLGYENISNITNDNYSMFEFHMDSLTGQHVHLHKWLHIVGVPVIVIVGLVANCLCLLTYCRTRLRVLSSSFYIASLSVVHTLYLLRWTVS